jgi:molybdopterin synthase catalytic subunit
MIALSDNEVSIEAVESAVAHPDCGADLLFVGRVRGVYKGQQVHHLEYEAYPEMAIRRMTEIAAQAFVQFEARVAIVHRIGKVLPNEISVVIAVATPHRAASYEASRFVLEALKRDVPIWKREITDEGAFWKQNIKPSSTQ